MTITTTAHLNFDGDARVALEFYARVFDGHLVVVAYGDAGVPAEAAASDRVMWGQVESADGFRVMAYDVPRPGRIGRSATSREQGLTLTEEPFFLSVRGDSVEDVAVRWERLADGAEIVQEFGPAQWSPGFGMLRDAFGVTWIVDVAVPYSG